MTSYFSSLHDALDAIVEFRDERDWEQYHTPQHLASAISIEAGELQEELLWKDQEQTAGYLESSNGKEAVRDEVGDVLIFALLFCYEAEIDPLKAIASKLDKNAEKYPADQEHEF